MRTAAGGVDAAVREALDRLGVAAEVMPCDPELADTAAFCAHYGVAPEDSANTILVVSKRGPRRRAACVVLATTRLDVNRAVCRLLGVGKASFAAADETRQLTGMAIGGVTPFGLPADLLLLVDSRVLGRRSVVVGGGSRSAKLRIAPAQLLLVPTAVVVDGLAAEVPEPAPGRVQPAL